MMNIYNENKRCKIKWYNLFWKVLITFSSFVVVIDDLLNVIYQISKYNDFTFLSKHIYFIDKFIRSKPVKKFKTIILAPITIILEISFFSRNRMFADVDRYFFKLLFLSYFYRHVQNNRTKEHFLKSHYQREI